MQQKKKLTQNKKSLFKTGGGSFNEVELTERDDKIKKSLEAAVMGIGAKRL